MHLALTDLSSCVSNHDSKQNYLDMKVYSNKYLVHLHIQYQGTSHIWQTELTTSGLRFVYDLSLIILGSNIVGETAV